MQMSVLALAAAAAFCVAFGIWGVGLVTANERVVASAIPTRSGKKKESDTFIIAALADVIGRPFTRPAMDILGPWRSGIRRRIDAAGRPNGMTVETYARRTVGYVIMFGLLGTLFVLQGSVLFGLFAYTAMFLNEFFLYSKARGRQDEIQRTMPDFLDVLVVTVTAGLSFRLALARVTESMPGVLADEFTVVLRQMDLGTSRREAFEDLRSRNSAESLNQFVTAILQAEELGAPLSNALVEIASDMRRESAQWAKRKAQKNTPKITIVTAVLVMPSLILIIIGGLIYGTDIDFSIFGG
jgi:tight adherence protein C